MLISRREVLTLFSGVLIIAASFIATLYIVAFLLPDSGWNSSPYTHRRNMIMGINVVLLPYALGGIFFGLRSVSNRATAILAGLVATLGERALTLGPAAMVLASFRMVEPDGSVYYVEGNENLLIAIQTEAIGYYGWWYILGGIPLSMLTLYLSARFVYRNFTVRNPNEPDLSSPSVEQL